MNESQDRFSAEKVARLARLELSANEHQQVQGELDRILEFVKEINALDLSGVEPFFGAVDSINPIREDEVQPGLTREQALANAPDSDGEFYRVPPVFGD
jgi:aspartyl-tRNA(Asn)/glutamyl-tRNA(Gln) amidotransferase subunit C